MPAEKLYAIIGHPLGHSLSPALHNWAFGETGHPGVYMAFPQDPEKVADFFTAMRALPIAGANVTIPFKVEALRQVDGASAIARRIGAVNTLYWRDGRLLGENTDVTGFMAPLQGRRFASAIVLGAGGASRAAVVALQELGVPRVALANRTFAKAKELAAELGCEALPWEDREGFACDLAVNATSLGMKGAREAESPVPPSFFKGRGLAYDIVYTPECTRFLADAAAAGWETQSGVAMFVEQARAAFALWTGQEMPEEGAYALVRAALAAK
ncbi:MAG: shikimate dehydrogenase [Desulfovibrio sp.]|jgi:shikimate dehydrogenase|nr:shikimate dehydrogenase [Desulfovibrio sp.]MBQ1539679.1 shikimate dehydrogenase [Desulfovibrio sp.]MBQ2516887.1 shikimate dehydrogenase [Desulfovibrio sp.]MCR5169814.1 shikimate dehydrogenase [Desulfovibrio sp.]